MPGPAANMLLSPEIGHPVCSAQGDQIALRPEGILIHIALSANGKGTSMNVLNQYSIVGMFGWINNRPMPMIADTLDSANSAWLFMGTGGTAWKVIIYCGSSMANRQTYVRLDYTKE